MNTIAVYTVKTDIIKEDKTKLQFNIVGENLVDATNSASYLKYNGEELGQHIVSIEKLIDKVYKYTYNIDDLNPNYKQKEDKNNENT
ncbi:hypothetical protein [Phocaeicola coprophilus]|uniref:hypothetical protein n=1 Tax=Phocaeicola coprophilus TaxID=387090 RepID=UPI00307881BF